MRTPALLSTLLALALPLQALAAPHVIGDLSDGALFGTVRSTAELQQDFAQHGVLIARAGEDLGLSRANLATVRHKIARGQARYVLIPRRLDGMAGQHDGTAFAVHDVTIPANVYGWEVDLQEPHDVLEVFIPNQCGNISYLRVHHAVIAAALPYVFTPKAVAAAPTAAPFVPLPASYAAPAPAYTLTQVAPPPPVSVPEVAAHHFVIWPLLAIALVGFAVGHGGGSYSSTGGVTPAPPVVVTPTPTPVSCPSAKRRIP